MRSGRRVEGDRPTPHRLTRVDMNATPLRKTSAGSWTASAGEAHWSRAAAGPEPRAARLALVLHLSGDVGGRGHRCEQATLLDRRRPRSAGTPTRSSARDRLSDAIVAWR